MAASASAGGYLRMLGALLPLGHRAAAAGRRCGSRSSRGGRGRRPARPARSGRPGRPAPATTYSATAFTSWSLSTPANGGMLMPPCVDHRRDEAGEAGRRERRADVALASRAVAAGAVLGVHAGAAPGRIRRRRQRLRRGRRRERAGAGRRLPRRPASPAAAAAGDDAVEARTGAAAAARTTSAQGADEQATRQPRHGDAGCPSPAAGRAVGSLPWTPPSSSSPVACRPDEYRMYDRIDGDCVDTDGSA